MWLCHRTSFDFLFLIPQFGTSIYIYFVSLIFITHKNVLGFLFLVFFFHFVLYTVSSSLSLNAQQQLWLDTGYKIGVDLILQGKQVKEKATCTAGFVPSGIWGAQELSESQPGSSQQQFYCLCCWGCRGSSSPALLHLSVGFLSLAHRRYAGGRAFFLLKTAAAQQKSRRKIQLEG